ncbi:hypothetical protein C8T65DRAFT_591652 [Cerioporus squamosus]|nr:hypothetical protein C8T65DRAFT_591652 [Cerioporus squamosus]
MSASHPEPARKRARLNEGSPESSIEDLVHNEELWLDDGNLVLVTGKTAFKVYRGLLAAQSPVFADMFATAAPDSEEMLDGSPVVHLSDSPEDMSHFLRALLPKAQRRVYVIPGEEPFTFMQLSALVRLAHKYQIEDVQSQAMASLKTYFADNFKDWNGDGAVPFPEPEPATGIEMVHLARLTHSPKLLPFALYFCTMGSSDVLDGWRREDGTVVRLEADDLKKFVSGYGKLLRMTDSVVSAIFTQTPSLGCGSRAHCRSALLDIREDILDHDAYPEPPLLHTWENIIESSRGKHALCRACSAMLITNDYNERSKLWKLLPALFGLTIDGWESE